MAIKKSKKAATKKVTKKAVKKVAKKMTKKAAPKKIAAKKVTARKAALKKPQAKAIPAATVTSNLNLGDSVPLFTVPSTGGTQFSLGDKKGKRIVLYFYPKDATPGCTIEGHEFTKLESQFRDANTEVYGVSRDSLESHEKFKEKECYSIELLSDENSQLCEIFDVIKDKNMYGKMVKGIERSTFIIDGEGRLQKEWRKVKAEGHAQEVLDFIKRST